MASEGPSWADQWGTGGIGAMEDDENAKAKKESEDDKKGNKAGLTKAKAAALAGANKLKTGTANSFKWIKNQCQRKGSSK